jgi:hypothetical protein
MDVTRHDADADTSEFDTEAHGKRWVTNTSGLCFGCSEREECSGPGEIKVGTERFQLF